jgi:cation:H+ antiporter
VSEAAPAEHPLRQFLILLGAFLLPLPWLLLSLPDLELVPEVAAPLAGLAILGSAFLLSWAVELAERDIPQSLALLVLALVSVLPEYAVDLHFAIRAAEDPEYARYAVANMTGANRLLIGLGWAAVVLVACRRGRTSLLEIPHHHRLEIRFLLLATLYSLLIPLSGTINLLDAAVLLGLFLWYAWSAAQGEPEHIELVGPAAWLDVRLGDTGRRVVGLTMLAFAAAAIFLSAEPFAEGLVEMGRGGPVDEFLLVQWVAPLASESPEFLVALMFAWRMRGAVGLGALISSKVNQWTLLVSALPIAYALAAGSTAGLPLDTRQSQELLLTSAQSLLATLLICNFGFTRLEAVMLAALFGSQLIFPSSDVRLAFSALYFAIFLGLMIHSPERRAAFLSVLRPGP